MTEIQRIKEYFKDLSFDEDTHKYFVKGNQLATSVSGVIKKYVDEQDFDVIASRLDAKFNFEEGTHKRLWKYKADAACALGTSVHYFGELYQFNRDLKPRNGFEEAIVKWWASLPEHIVPAFSELQMYHNDYMFGGTADIILYNKNTGKFIIADYKTNEDLFKNFKGKKLKGVFSNLLEHGYNKYQVQFSLYQILLEQTGVEVEKRCLIHLLPNGEFKQYFTEDYTDVIREDIKKTGIC